jgi:hypothetical protein
MQYIVDYINRKLSPESLNKERKKEESKKEIKEIKENKVCKMECKIKSKLNESNISIASLDEAHTIP